jgi:hypothetical protein
VFTARYGLSPYITQIHFSLKVLMCNRFLKYLQLMTLHRTKEHNRSTTYLDAGIPEEHGRHLHDWCGTQIRDPLLGTALQQDEM